MAEKEYPGCITLSDYRELFSFDDVDLVVNASYSEMHYPITKDLLLHGKNVLVEKPFARSRYECDELLQIAKREGVLLAVFQQTFLAPFYEFCYDTIKSGKLGQVKQISIRYNGFARRWDWQTLQKKCAGSIATADRLVRVAVKEAGIPLTDAVRMITATPARIMGLAHKGSIAPGMDADLVVFNEEITVKKVFARGREVK